MGGGGLLYSLLWIFLKAGRRHEACMGIGKLLLGAPRGCAEMHGPLERGPRVCEFYGPRAAVGRSSWAADRAQVRLGVLVSHFFTCLEHVFRICLFIQMYKQ